MLGLASDVFESYSAGTEIKSSINQDAANVYQEMAELLGITLKQLMNFVMTMMVYTGDRNPYCIRNRQGYERKYVSYAS